MCKFNITKFIDSLEIGRYGNNLYITGKIVPRDSYFDPDPFKRQYVEKYGYSATFSFGEIANLITSTEPRLLLAKGFIPDGNNETTYLQISYGDGKRYTPSISFGNEYTKVTYAQIRALIDKLRTLVLNSIVKAA